MEKSASAFRTISEVADFLETPAHVLRFWESRFPQIKPVKRAGGRRYYRPADVALLAGIKRLLHDEGMTIRGVQKILREQGVRHVSGMSETDSEELDAALTAAFAPDAVADKPEAQIVSLSEWVSVTDTPLAPKTTVPETAIPPETTIPEAVSPEVLPSDAATHPAATIEPVITDDEIVEEDAFRSAMDWAKSLGAADTSVSAPTDAILQLTERVAIEAGKQGDDPFAEAEVFAAEVYTTIDDDFGSEDALHADALSPDAAAESPSDDPVMEQPGLAASDSMAPTSPAPSHEETEANDQAPSIWLPTQLRARTAADLAPNSPTLRALHARLAALHSRMADAARSSRA